MRMSLVLPLVVGLGAIVPSLSAQGTPPSVRDSGRVVGIIGGSPALHPARFVLAHRSDLALTPAQVTTLEELATAQEDPDKVRMRRRMEESRGATNGRATYMMINGWSGPVDEAAIRDEARRMSAALEESMLSRARDRHAVGAVLTPEQIAMLPGLESGDMFRPMSQTTGPGMPQGAGHPYFEFQVERPATMLAGNGPVYPPELKAANVEGEVLAQFVVDTTGRVEPGSFKVLKSSHSLFTQAVRDALPAMRFTPAEVGGRKVRQIVQQPYSFSKQ